MHAAAAAVGLGSASAASAAAAASAPLPTLMHMGYGAPHHRHMLTSNHQDQTGMWHRSAWWLKKYINKQHFSLNEIAVMLAGGSATMIAYDMIIIIWYFKIWRKETKFIWTYILRTRPEKTVKKYSTCNLHCFQNCFPSETNFADDAGNDNLERSLKIIIIILWTKIEIKCCKKVIF